MFRRPHLIALAAVVLVVAIVLNLPPRAAASIKLAVGALFLPLFGVAGLSHQAAEKAGDALVPRKVLTRELNFLREENARLKAQINQSQEILKDNQSLSQALGVRPKLVWPVKFARVTGRDTSNWWRAIFIDVGSRDGVKANLPVISNEGLIGKVVDVGFGQSRVVLIGDPNCPVSATIRETKDNTGSILKSSPGNFDYQLVELTYLPNSPEIKAGQRVVTSGLGGVFPAGILIGQILDIRSVGPGLGLYQEARVKLAANLNQLEDVWVILR